VKATLKVLVLMSFVLAAFGPMGVVTIPALAQQNPQMRDDLEQFAMDLHVGMQRANLTEQQREQMRKDLQTLREARQNHHRIAAYRAFRNFRSILDSGAFQPEDQQRIKMDMQQLREAREQEHGGAM
jgi:hypothetical protein